MSGHVFIVQGDIRYLACDAWLMPCDWEFRPGQKWYKDKPGLPKDWRPTGSPSGGRVLEPPDWPLADTLPKAWLVDVGLTFKPLDELTEKDKAWFRQSLVEFFDAAAPRAINGERFLKGRAKPLLALPVIGTGQGGAARRVDQMVQDVLLPEMYEAASKYDIDVALVAFEAPVYAGALAARERYAGLGHTVWPTEISDDLRRHAERLAKAAQAGKLTLFIGAGVSMGAGAPSWGKLLRELAAKAGIHLDQDEQASNFDKLGALDQASLIASRLEQQEQQIGQAVAEVLSPYVYLALSHTLLAVLPVSEVVTTNYDSLFEDASRLAKREVAILPYEPATGGRWLLKMHGSVTVPDDIVLTRSDYLRYDERRAALRGIVQAMLITRHMLFVGFSLTDDNFYRIIDDVRRAVRGDNRGTDAGLQSKPFGSALMLERNSLFEELWKGDLEWAWLSDKKLKGTHEFGQAARLLEILLDYLASRAVDVTAYLLDERFKHLLSEDEHKLHAALHSFIDNTPEEAKRAPAWQQVKEMLERLGYPRSQTG